MNSSTSFRSLRQRKCLFCQFKAARRKVAYATISENLAIAPDVSPPPVKEQRQKLRRLDYDLRHQLLLSTTTDAFKKKFHLKNFEDYWSDERKIRTKKFLDRSSQLEARCNSRLEGPINEGNDGMEGKEAWEADERTARENISDLVLLQIGLCQNADELLRIIVVALERSVATECVRQHQDKLVSVLQRIWNHIVKSRMGDSKEMDFLKALNAILSRLRKAGIQLQVQLLELALIVAFRQNSMSAVRSLLQEIKRNQINPQDVWRPSNELLDAVVRRSKFVSSHDIHGATRTKNDVAQLIVEHPGSSQDACLEKFVNLSQPEVLLRWLRILGLYGTCEGIWVKWLEWRKRIMNDHERNSEGKVAKNQQKMEISLEFVKALLAQNGIAEAWKVMNEAELEVNLLPANFQDILLERLELANGINSKIQDALLQKYERDLVHIEQALRVRWTGGDAGYHVAYDSGNEPEY